MGRFFEKKQDKEKIVSIRQCLCCYLFLKSLIPKVSIRLYSQRTVHSIRESGLLSNQLQELVSQMSEKTFKKDEGIFASGNPTTPIMYVVRSGKVKITKEDGSSEFIESGGYFGQEHLLFQNKNSRSVVPKHVTPEYSATAISRTVCGMITLEDLAAVTGQTSQKPDAVTHIALKDLKRHKLIGEGQFGLVWLVTNSKVENAEPLALKVQKLKTVKTPDRSKAIRKETKIMKGLQHQFIVKLMNVYKEADSMSMLMSLAPGGELFDVIHRKNEEGYWISGMDENIAKFYSAVIADTLAFMHKQKYIYRDLKPENILLDKDGYPVITDFGFGEYNESWC